MRSLAKLVVAVGLGGFAAAHAQPAPAPAAGPSILGGGGPIDTTSDTQERVGPQHVVLKGNVEAVQGTARLRTPQLDLFYAQKTGAPKAATPGGGVGSLERMEAQGPVYYVTPTQTAKGDHGTYVQADDAIILDGNVILTQGRDVSTGDHLVIHQKTSQAIMTSAPGKRTRSVIYPNEPAPGAAATGKPAAATGKSPAPRS